jgi:nucleoside-diphosphate-sugar epimerase
MTSKRIIVTGASGCIGHYITEALIRETKHELFLLVRNPDKLQFDCKARPGINIIKADLRDIEDRAELLGTMNAAILAATAWGGAQEVFDVNVGKTVRLINLLNPELCEQVIYFSTASVLDRNNQLLKEAGQLGTDYIRSKYDCLSQLSRLPLAKRVTTLFPTLVLGGDSQHPYSHLSSGLPDVARWIDLIRFLKADGSFHFIHGKDIATVVLHLLKNPPDPDAPRQFVLGNQQITVNEAVEQVCAYLNKKISFRLTLHPWLAEILIVLFRIQLAPWDRFCLNYRHFTYKNPVSPATFGLPVYCRTFTEVLKLSGIPDRRTTPAQFAQTEQE